MITEAQEYAAKLIGKDPRTANDLLMHYANKLAVKYRTSYADCKELIAFCFDGGKLTN